jgi:hypothetical protein
MIELLVVLAYFAIGIVLFFSFWRWCALEDDNTGNAVTSFMLLFFWPLTLGVLALCLAWVNLLVRGKEVMKK